MSSMEARVEQDFEQCIENLSSILKVSTVRVVWMAVSQEHGGNKVAHLALSLTLRRLLERTAQS